MIFTLAEVEVGHIRKYDKEIFGNSQKSNNLFYSVRSK